MKKNCIFFQKSDIMYHWVSMMSAKIIKITSKTEYDKLDEAAKLLAEGALVAFPTETVYGLGGNALCGETVKQIYAAKGRPSDNPLIVHIAEKKDVYPLVKEVTPAAEKVMEHLWPGPVTFILEKSDRIPDAVTAGGKTVAVRLPEHEIARELIQRSGVPVAAPSANLSGRPSPTKASHVEEDLGDKIACIVDGGNCRVGLESTVIDLTSEPPRILRPGGVTQEMLSALLGEVEGYAPKDEDENAPKSPGMKYKHYAPNAYMMVFDGANCRKNILKTVEANFGKRIVVLTAGETEDYPCETINCGETPEVYAQNLFDILRQADEQGAEVIFAEIPFAKGGIATALRNRIYKSAGGNVMLCG